MWDLSLIKLKLKKGKKGEGRGKGKEKGRIFLCKMQKQESNRDQASNRQKDKKTRKVIKKHTHKQKTKH